MHVFSIVSKLLPALACLLLHVKSVGSQCFNTPPLVINGKHFYQSDTGAYFPIKGLAYYPRPNSGINDVNNHDFYTEEYRSMWERDIEEFKAIHINAIRLYAVDPSKNHDAFMCALKSAGIYALIELGAQCKNCSITSDAPPLCYPAELKTRGEFIISAFAKYDNVLAYSAGNEVGLYLGLKNAPCQKKFIRDMRAYIQGCPTMRKIPIGIVVADIDNANNAMYYNCRTNVDDDLETVEWYGINAYRYCSPSTDFGPNSGFYTLVSEFGQYQLPVPVILAEFDCISSSFPTIDGYSGQRDFMSARALFTFDYLQEFTGGFAFEYSSEAFSLTQPWPYKKFDRRNFGIGYLSGEDCDDISKPCEYIRYPQFYNLSDAYASIVVDSPPNGLSRPIPECRSTAVSLDSFIWPGDSVDSWECLISYDVYCPVAPGCGPTLSPTLSRAPTMAPIVITETPTPASSTTTKPPSSSSGSTTTSFSFGVVTGTAEPTVAPTPVMTEAPTLHPSMYPTMSPTMTPSMSPTDIPSAIAERISLVPTRIESVPAVPGGPLSQDTQAPTGELSSFSNTRGIKSSSASTILQSVYLVNAWMITWTSWNVMAMFCCYYQ
jgi:1,3-beta-glucanosyltransferase GAS5